MADDKEKEPVSKDEEPDTYLHVHILGRKDETDSERSTREKLNAAGAKLEKLQANLRELEPRGKRSRKERWYEGE